MDYGDAVYLLRLKSQEYFAELEDAFENNLEKWTHEIAEAVVGGRQIETPEVPARPNLAAGVYDETRELLVAFEYSYDELKNSLTLELLNNIKKRLLLFAKDDDNLFKQWESRLHAVIEV